MKITNIERKKELLEEWKSRHPEMGVISFCCERTGESFLGISTDTKADYNGNYFKLSMGNHPNKRMQELFNTYGEDAFEYAVLKILKYDDPKEDHTKELEDGIEEIFTFIVPGMDCKNIHCFETSLTV